MELSEFEEIPLGLTQTVEKEWEGNGIGEASDRLPLLNWTKCDLYPFVVWAYAL